MCIFDKGYNSTTLELRGYMAVKKHEVEETLQPDEKLPLWRNREIWGRVMGTAHVRSGAYGHAIRRGEAWFEPSGCVGCVHA